MRKIICLTTVISALTLSTLAQDNGIDPEVLIDLILQVETGQRNQLDDLTFDAVLSEGDRKGDSLVVKSHFTKKIFVKYVNDTAWFHEDYLEYYQEGQKKSDKDCVKEAKKKKEKAARSNAEGGRFLGRALVVIERVGNALPHPAILFGSLAVVVVLLSGLFAWLEISAVHPGTGETIHPVSLLTIEGMHRMLIELITNFTSFAPLGTVLVSLLGIGIAERGHTAESCAARCDAQSRCQSFEITGDWCSINVEAADPIPAS